MAMALHSISQHEHELFGPIDVPSLAGCDGWLAHSLTKGAFRDSAAGRLYFPFIQTVTSLIYMKKLSTF